MQSIERKFAMFFDLSSILIAPDGDFYFNHDKKHIMHSLKTMVQTAKELAELNITKLPSL